MRRRRGRCTFLQVCAQSSDCHFGDLCRSRVEKAWRAADAILESPQFAARNGGAHTSAA
jgi:hypothetical protein